MSEGRTDIKKGIFRRVRVLYALFFFVGMLIAGKILYLQYGPKGPALRNKGTTITYERVKLEADRGDVLASIRWRAVSLPFSATRAKAHTSSCWSMRSATGKRTGIR